MPSNFVPTPTSTLIPSLSLFLALSDSIKASLSRFGPKADEASSAKSDSKKTTDTLAQKMRNQLNAAKFRQGNEGQNVGNGEWS